MSANVEDALIEKVRMMSPEQQKQVLKLVDGFVSNSEEEKSIWDEIDEIVQSAPEGTWDSLPSDGSMNVDHYLYGAPKK